MADQNSNENGNGKRRDFLKKTAVVSLASIFGAAVARAGTVGRGRPVPTTLAVGEEGGGQATSLAMGEEGGEYTTMALGEEGGDHEYTTLALGEEGGSKPVPKRTEASVRTDLLERLAEVAHEKGLSVEDLLDRVVNQYLKNHPPIPEATTLALGEEG